MNKKTILITGCSTGIGYHAALALTERGHIVIASARKQSDVEKLNAKGLTSIQLDVNSSESIQQAMDKVIELTQGRLDVLINNAGFAQAGALEDIPRTALRGQFETNVFGLMELTSRVIPLMREQKQGRIINISSVLGKVCMPFRGAYNASKHALEGLSDSLRLELKQDNIKVITIQPGPIESNFRDTAVDGSLKAIDTKHSRFAQHYQVMLKEFKQKKANSIFTQKPDKVVKKFIHAIEAKRPSAHYSVTAAAHFLILMKRILPTFLLDKLLLTISKKEINPETKIND